MPRISKTDRDESIAALREALKPGDTVYCILRSVSRSGVQRVISFVTVRDRDVRTFDYHIARVLGYSPAKGDNGIIVKGCGMDMGFHVVYSLGRVLFPDGFKVKGRGRNGDTSGHDKDGGYALNARWL